MAIATAEQIAGLYAEHGAELDAEYDTLPPALNTAFDQLPGTEDEKCAVLRELIARRDALPQQPAAEVKAWARYLTGKDGE